MKRDQCRLLMLALSVTLIQGAVLLGVYQTGPQIKDQYAWTTRVTRYVRHTVAPGDTLSQIAKVYGTTTEKILKENNLDSQDSLTAGKTLLIPVKGYKQKLII